MRLPAHRRLLTTTFILLASAGIAWFVLLRPIVLDNNQRTEDQSSTSSDLRRKGYPLDPARLKKIRSDYNSQEAELQSRLSKVYDKARAQFESRLSAYPSVLGFRRSIFTLDYQEVYNKIRSELADKQIYLNEDILGLSDQSTSPQTYRLVAHMWTVRDLAMLARDNGLDLKDYSWQPPLPKDAPPDAPRPRVTQYPARIHVEPVRTYTVSPDTPYYLEEYPVKITVTGNLQQISEFVSDLTRGNNYLPLESAALRKIDEEDNRSQRIEATLVCSSFLIITERSDFAAKVEQQDSTVNIPPISGGSP